jgi:hypothetical protein
VEVQGTAVALPSVSFHHGRAACAGVGLLRFTADRAHRHRAGDSTCCFRQQIPAKARRTFTVDALPDEAGVDPFLLVSDRIPDDNVKKLTLSNAITVAASNRIL